MSAKPDGRPAGGAEAGRANVVTAQRTQADRAHAEGGRLPPGASLRQGAAGRAIGALMLREMATTYGRSAGGYAWAVLEPVGGIALLSLIFALGFQKPALGVSFPLFYASGLVPFLAWAAISGRVATALLFSKSLLAYPTVTWADALIARFLLTFLVQALVALLVFGGILWAFETRAVPQPGPLALAAALVGALGLGIGTLNAYLFTALPAWQMIWSVLMRPMFLISGIFFLPDGLSQPWRERLMWNPVLHVVGLVRRGLYPGYDAPWVSALLVVVWALVPLVVGLFLLRWRARDLLND